MQPSLSEGVLLLLFFQVISGKTRAVEHNLAIKILSNLIDQNTKGHTTKANLQRVGNPRNGFELLCYELILHLFWTRHGCTEFSVWFSFGWEDCQRRHLFCVQSTACLFKTEFTLVHNIKSIAYEKESVSQENSSLGKISAQPHPTLCIQFLNRENNDKNNTFPLGKQICFTIVWGCAETLLFAIPVVICKSYRKLEHKAL